MRGLVTNPREEVEKAAGTACELFHGKVNDDEVEQWMVMLPIHDLPAVLSAIEELPKSPDETKLENALHESIALNWKKLSSAQVNNAVNTFLYSLRSALLPIEKQTLMVIGRSVLRIEDKVDQLAKLVEQLKPYARDAQSGISVGRLTVGGNVSGSVVFGNNNVVTQITNNYYQQIVEKNIERHEPDYWNLKHPYPMPPNFTGRVAERAMLTQWLNDDSENRLFILRALGGFGKSALTWHWLTHDVDAKQWQKVVFWSFYEGDVEFDSFVANTLSYLGIRPGELDSYKQTETLIKLLQRPGILLILDGFERILRAYSSMSAAYQGDGEEPSGDNEYDSVNINADRFLKTICVHPSVQSKILLTSRLTPRIVRNHGVFLKGCLEKELFALSKDDAINFFRAQGVRGTYIEIASACESYGYHPLSLRIIAGLIINDLEAPGDINAIKKLKITHDIIQNKHHVLEQAYTNLSSEARKLLSYVACLRSPVEYNVLRVIAKNQNTLNDNLRHLLTGGLLNYDKRTNKYDLHPIVRRYVYDRLKDAERNETHSRLRNYFAAVDLPQRPENLEDLRLVIELYHHTVRAGQFDKALNLFKEKLATMYFQLGSYQTIIELLSPLFSQEKLTPNLRDKSDQSWTLTQLANCYSMIGQPRLGIEFEVLANNIDEKRGAVKGDIIGLLNIGSRQIKIGEFKNADISLQRGLEKSREIIDETSEACCNEQLGCLSIYCGRWQDASNEIKKAERVFSRYKGSRTNYLSILNGDRALGLLFMKRSGDIKAITIDFAHSALKSAEETARAWHSFEVDFIRSYWLLGASYIVLGQLRDAEVYIGLALNRCRGINLVDFESDILLDLARLRYDQKNYEEAKSLADEALSITERCG